MFVTTLALAALAVAQQTDTTFPVRAGSRLEVNNFGGEIAVRAWDRSEVRLHAEHSSRDRIEVSADGQVVTVKASNRRGPPQQVDYDITVPKGMALTLSGVYTDIRVTGVEAEISGETVQRLHLAQIRGRLGDTRGLPRPYRGQFGQRGRHGARL